MFVLLRLEGALIVSTYEAPSFANEIARCVAYALRLQREKKKEKKKKKKHEKEDVGEANNESDVVDKNTVSIKESEDANGVNSEKDVEESDDDIFGDIGEYVPPSSVQKDTAAVALKISEAGSSTSGKTSIFTGLGLPDESIDSSRPQTVYTTTAPKLLPSSTKLTADRELKGLSMSSYNGGYGEEVDVDFDGRMEDEGNDKKKRKHSLYETTASKEYGSKNKGKQVDPYGDE